jgi:endo-1,4-beta-xylanase
MRTAVLLLLAASAFAQPTLRQQGDRLKLLISAAVNPAHLDEPDYAAALSRELNCIEPENAMKWRALRPDRSTFNFSAADRIVEFAKAHNQLVRGHTLAWHVKNPAWLTDRNFSPAELATILREHIERVMKYYAGKVFAWDVINEAFNDDGTMRSTLWYDSPGIGFAGQGTKYIEQIFRWARAADPKAKLFYNDYSNENINRKSDAIYAMAKDFKERGVPLDGVGFQMHLSLKSNLATVAENMARLNALGLEVQIAELDVAIPINAEGQPQNPADLEKQAAVYRQATALCSWAPNCTLLQIWGITDKYSWLPGYSKGKNGAGLPLDAQYTPKPAHSAVIEVLRKTPTRSAPKVH